MAAWACAPRGYRVWRRLIFYKDARRGFRKAPKKNEPRNVEPDEKILKDLASRVNRTSKSSLTPMLDEPVLAKSSSSRSFRRLVRPFVFTVGFTGSSFGVAAIWQYESLKSRVQSYFNELRLDWLEKHHPPKAGDIRKQVNQWWNSLTEGQRTVTGIIAANALVFCLWRVPSMQRTMVKYFTSNPASTALCLPMVLSTFSHYSFFHMAANMYVLWSFSSSIVQLLGQEQFMAVYLSAGVISTFASYVYKTATGRLGASLGASGAIMTVLAAVCSKMPEAKLAIILLPMFTFTASSALKAIIAMDTTGLILGWRFFDHAAHLGGAIFGIWYIFYGHELIWKNREPLVKMWHDMRTKGPGSGGRGPS
ncbi:presenilin-associated rhomboid-like protein, mitochondrial [Hemiscyllium ocellatum]|uniref:presenilin-associated rhomboid-like protein, mitochondrial n=1 Tax=Hemiscyllium ocellatum TaxID=170820 RepID=UPI0029661A8B|nr:presenilin-associated rhomboid-like protein, mitochondrial [Hemiscyllium ocellatum]